MRPCYLNIIFLSVILGYWKNLSASLTFSGEKAKEYLLVIHEDIIRGWNFNDPEMVRTFPSSSKGA